VGSSGASMLDDAQELDWAAYTARPSQGRRHRYRHQRHLLGRQMPELSDASITEHYPLERGEGLRLIAAARHHRDLTPASGAGTNSH